MIKFFPPKLALIFCCLCLLECLQLAAQQNETNAKTLIVGRLRTNDFVAPVGIDEQPRFSWVTICTDSNVGNVLQQACEVQIALNSQALNTGRPDVWDSKRSATNTNAYFPYHGKSLHSATNYFWRVRVWTNKGISSWSPVSTFTTGLLQADDWHAGWIKDSRQQSSEDTSQYKVNPAPLFRKQFSTNKKIANAYLFITGLGYNEVFLNGRKIGNRMLEGAWTNYDKRIYYSSYEVTTQVIQGENKISVMLGNGWYNPLPLHMWSRLDIRKYLPVGQPSFIAHLKIKYEDGSEDIIASDTSWKVRDSYILKNSIYLGELHDMRLFGDSYSSGDIEGPEWRAVTEATPPKGKLMNQRIPAVTVNNELKAISWRRILGGDIVVDFGKNFGGIARIVAKGNAGDTISVKYGELIYPDGSVNVMTSVAGQIKTKGAGGEGAPDTAYRYDQFILSGKSFDTLQPHFSFTGFRYMQVKGFNEEPLPNSFTGMQMHTDVQRTSAFSTSDPLVNTIYQNSINSFLSNLFSVQSDCPHRERFGYGGDIVVTANAFLENFDMASFYRKTLDDFTDAQLESGGFTETAPYVGISDEALSPSAGPIGWGYAYPVLMEELFRYTGDISVIKDHYTALRNWVDYLALHSKDLIIDKGISDHESLDPKPVALTGTAFFYSSTMMLSNFASILNNKPDELKYSLLAKKISGKFVATFLDTASGKFSIGTQAAQSFALYFDLVPKEYQAKAFAVLKDQIRLKNDHLSTGIFGTLYMLKTLSDNGNEDLAWTITQKKDFPGWGYMIERGATTLWEHWEYSDDVYSHNHPMFGSICEWFIKYLAGIRPQENAAGMNKIIVNPLGINYLDSLSYAFESVNGTVAIHWNKENSGTDIQITIPVNSEALIYIPVLSGQQLLYRGKAYDTSHVSYSDGKIFIREAVGSGTYHFRIEPASR